MPCARLSGDSAGAGLGEGYAVRYLEPALDLGDQIMLDLLTRAAAWLGPERTARRPAIQRAFYDFLRRQSEMLGSLDDPGGLYALCFCEVE